MASAGTAACAAPTDYSELFLEYGEDIRRMVWHHLLPPARREDVDDGVSYIFQQFVKNDILAMYDRDHVSDYNFQPVKFRAFVMHWVELYCRGLRDTQRRHAREPLLVDAPAPDGAPRLVDFLGSVLDEYPSFSDGDAMERLRAALAARAPAPGSSPVLPLFDALAARFAEGKSVLPGAVRLQFGKNQAEVTAWFDELKAALAEIGQDAEAPPAQPVMLPPGDPAALAWLAGLRGRAELGGMALSAAEVRAAASALKNAPGNRVLPAFRDAGHRLAGAGKTWYLDFAEQVMRAHPELRTPKGGHYPGGHFGKVKHALIFGLDYLAPPLTPQEEEALAAAEEERWAELEAAIWRLPGFTVDKVDAALEAVRLVAA